MIENNELAAELAAADEERLTALSSRGLFKRAVKDVEDMTGDYVISGNSALVKMGSEKCIIKAPLESSSCTCPSRTVCRHLIGAVLLLKRELPPDAGAAVPEKEETPEPEPAKPEPCVPGGGGTSVLLVNHTEAGILLPVAVADFPAPVGAPVIHDDHFVVPECLGQNAVQAFPEIRKRIIDWQNQTDFRHAAPLLRSP